MVKNTVGEEGTGNSAHKIPLLSDNLRMAIYVWQYMYGNVCMYAFMYVGMYLCMYINIYI